MTLVGSAAAQPPAMKMTTEIPDGIATPDKLETSLGTLTSFDGVPDEETTRKVYDNLALQRATQAFLQLVPDLLAQRDGARPDQVRPAEHHGAAFRGPDGLEGTLADSKYRVRLYGHLDGAR